VIGFLSRSIPRRILAALLSIYLVTYFATAIVVYSGVRSSILGSNDAAQSQLANLKYEQLAGVIGALGRDVTAWSNLEVMNDLVSGDIDKRVTQTLEASKRLYDLTGDIYAFDATGKLIASSRTGSVKAAPDHIPPEWNAGQQRLVLVGKEPDPMTGVEVVALGIPIFGSFDKSYRIGTLVMTYPWASIEKLLFSVGDATILMETGGHRRILAAKPADIVGQIGFDPARPGNDQRNSGFVIGRSIPRSGLIANWEVITLQDMDATNRSLRAIAIQLALLGVFLGIPIVFLGRWLSRRLTAPIADLTRVVREIADTDKLDARVPVSSSDELGSLARSFNRMTDNLERATSERKRLLLDLAAFNQSLEAKIADRTADLEAAMKAQQRLIGDISHEIKSPLARLSMALGLARRAAASDMAKQFDRMEREIGKTSALASELLTLAKLDGAAVPPEFVPVDLPVLIDQIVADALYEKPARSSDVFIRIMGEGLTIDANADLMRRAIENIVRNAIFYTAEGTMIEVIVTRRGPEAISIIVKDLGPGVPDTALDHLFEPFYRVDEARARETGGTGIGLAICQRVILLHGGSIRAVGNTPHGLVVEIELPSVRST
jgi:signal transduction histidine kinase